MSAIQTPRVRRELAKGPATCQELADLLGMTLRNVHVALWVLQCQKHAAVIAKMPNDGAKQRNLYELTTLGHYHAKRKRRPFHRSVVGTSEVSGS